MTRNIVIVALLACGGCAKGVAPLWSTANPSTHVELGPLKVFNNKDFVFEGEDIEVITPKGVTVRAKRLYMGDTATSVRIANTAQLDATNNLTKTVLEPVNKALDLAAPIVAARVNAPPKPPDPIKEAVGDAIRNPFITPGTPKITYTPKENQ